ncbi:hypothetical protein HX858_08990, partial [Marine Group I thaumarchaeote]|nr:hypothetical protein [Marine Group I thaumarchaeote]
LTLSKRPAGTLITWAGNKGITVTDTIQKEFSDAGITLTKDTVFEVISGDNGKKIRQNWLEKPQSVKYLEVGGGATLPGLEDDNIIGFTTVYNKIEDYKGTPAGTVGWKKWIDNKFKELKMGASIVWGSETPALETAQCLGMLLSSTDINKISSGLDTDPDATRAEWNPKLIKHLDSSYDWNSAGKARLKDMLPKMPLPNWTEVILLAKGTRNFVDKYAVKNLGTKLYFVHGKIDDYYKAEIANPAIEVAGSKDNTADIIISNVDATKLIAAVKTDPMIYKEGDANLYCHSTDESESIKYYQVSLKKGHEDAQIGKMTAFVRARYKDMPSAIELYYAITQKNSYEPILNTYLAENNLLTEGIFGDAADWVKSKVDKGLGALKDFAFDWWEKIKAFGLKVKAWATGALGKLKRIEAANASRPNSFQQVIAAKMKHAGALSEGKISEEELLTEAARITGDGINKILETTDLRAIKILVTSVNDEITRVNTLWQDTSKWYLVPSVPAQDLIKDTVFTNRGGKLSWTKKDAINLLGNASAFRAFDEMIAAETRSMSDIAGEMIQLEKEIFFGKTTMPVFKVYGASSWTDTVTDTTDVLGTQASFVSGKTERLGLDEDTMKFPVAGLRVTRKKQNKFYTVYGTIIEDMDDKSKPKYLDLRMGGNQGETYSFVIEATNPLTWDKFKKYYKPVNVDGQVMK